MNAKGDAHEHESHKRASGEWVLIMFAKSKTVVARYILFAARYFHLTLAFLQIKNARRGSRILIEFRGTESRSEIDDGESCSLASI
jgi:hypothetical protein